MLRNWLEDFAEHDAARLVDFLVDAVKADARAVGPLRQDATPGAAYAHVPFRRRRASCSCLPYHCFMNSGFVHAAHTQPRGRVEHARHDEQRLTRVGDEHGVALEPIFFPAFSCSFSFSKNPSRR